MGYNQNFGPSRKGAKHGKDMVSRIMSNEDTMAPLNNSIQYLKGMKDAKNGTKGGGMDRKSYMKGDSYSVPAEKLKSIQGGLGRHTSEHSTEEYLDKKDKAIKSSMKEEGLSRFKSYAQQKAVYASKAEQAPSRQKYGGNEGDLKRSAKRDY